VDRVPDKVKGRLLSADDRDAALARLARDVRRNLFLFEIVSQLGRHAAAHEAPSQVLGAFREGALVGLAAIRPSLVLEADLEEEAIDAFLPFIEAVETGLVKSAETPVDALWQRLRRRGRHALLDRHERTYVVEPGSLRAVEPPAGASIRAAVAADWEPLVTAARASLREEQRPDPFDGDPRGFRLWVRGRIGRARVVEVDGRVVFVGYADVRRREGWLIQGVYTWPDHRRRGLAAAGMSALVREAFESGASHVQLAVVEGNEPAMALYRRLGFSPADRLRTILFH